MTSRARKLRKDLTEAEKKLWRALRRDQLGGLNFRRQHPIGPYVLDFYCPKLGLAVEVDGGHTATFPGTSMMSVATIGYAPKTFRSFDFGITTLCKI